jgi:hypothetical protein
MKVAGNKKGALGMSGTPLLIAAVVTRLGGAAGSFLNALGTIEAMNRVSGGECDV